MPSMNDSSEPVETSSTRIPSTGRSANARANPRSVTAPDRLSLAPGTTCRAPMSAKLAALAPASSVPRRRSPRHPTTDPSSTASGPATTGNITGAVVSLRSISCGWWSAM